ncbi:MAG: ABC transporter ATP-binding protein [Betaproteobacteria bacterium]|nr:ABC transporter ATP-binding protein [Betaproteobacteria bacterium]
MPDLRKASPQTSAEAQTVARAARDDGKTGSQPKQALLSIEGLCAGYDGAQVLADVSIEIGAGEAVALMGRNGMGKTTLIRAIMGTLCPTAGTIRFRGQRIDGRPVHRVVALGIGLVPEGRQIFPSLSVEENLLATAANRAGGSPTWTLEGIYGVFPDLRERRRNMGNTLSGGEQQMLAIARALMTNPLLLVLDEATEGLAPFIRGEIWRILANLKAAGQSILIVDKYVKALAHLADRHYLMEKGRLVWSGDSEALLANASLVHRYVGV